MKKFYISFILIIVVFSISSICFGAQFYDTLGTKYESPTEILYTLGIVNGTSEHVFSANREITRAEMAKLVFSVYDLEDWLVDAVPSGKKVFKDVKDSAWYYDYVCIANDMGIINGYSDGTFRPNEKVTYAEAIAMLIRALGYTELTVKPGDTWEMPYIRKMNDIRLAKNVGYFKNSDYASRGNIAIMIWNMLNCETYMIVKEKTYTGFVKDTVPGKIIDRYYPDYAIIDDDILEKIYIEKGADNDEDSAEYAIATKKIDYVQVSEPIPLRRIGAKVSGIYNIEENMAIGLNFIYDEKFDEGSTLELEELYKLNVKKSNEYVVGNSKNYAYVYFEADDKIDRITYLGSNENILVREAKMSKASTSDDKENYILINDETEIDISEILIDENGKCISWSSVKENSVISKIENNIYIYYDTIKQGELEEVAIKDEKLCLTVNGNLYECDESAIYKLYGSETLKKATKKNLQEYIGRDVELIVSYSGEVMQISLDRNYKNAAGTIRFGVVIATKTIDEGRKTNVIRVATSTGTKIMYLTEDVYDKELEIGTLIHFEYEDSQIEFLDVFADGVKIPGGVIDMDIEKKEYSKNTLGNYTIDDETVIYIIEKEYQVNSDKSIKNYKMRVEDDRKILENLEKMPVHVVYDDMNNAVAVFIEKDVNKYDYKYGRVLEVYQDKITDDQKNDKYVLKIKVSPFNNIVSEYTLKGIVNCEPGDLISYTTNETELIVKERYNTKVLGDKRDYIIENVKNKIAYLTNGEQIDFTKDSFEVNGKKYLFEKYIVVYARVTNMSGEWKFYSATIEEPEKLILKAGDRIAIDEIEDLIVIYRGYND